MNRCNWVFRCGSLGSFSNVKPVLGCRRICRFLKIFCTGEYGFSKPTSKRSHFIYFLYFSFQSSRRIPNHFSCRELWSTNMTGRTIRQLCRMQRFGVKRQILCFAPFFKSSSLFIPNPPPTPTPPPLMP